jgi:hypothetical protein
MLIEAMATHEALKKKLLWIQFEKKTQHCLFKYIWFWVKMKWVTHRFTFYVTYNLSIRGPIWASMFLSKTLVLTNYCNMDILFSTMIEKCSYTLNFCLGFYFLTYPQWEVFPLAFYYFHPFKHYPNMIGIMDSL